MALRMLLVAVAASVTHGYKPVAPNASLSTLPVAYHALPGKGNQPYPRSDEDIATFAKYRLVVVEKWEGPCWLRCVNNGGDGGFKFFCEKDEDDSKQTDADTIRIGSFTLTPSEFYLYSGSAIDIYVSFNPEKEGKLEENLILACDN